MELTTLDDDKQYALFDGDFDAQEFATLMDQVPLNYRVYLSSSASDNDLTWTGRAVSFIVKPVMVSVQDVDGYTMRSVDQPYQKLAALPDGTARPTWIAPEPEVAAE